MRKRFEAIIAFCFLTTINIVITQAIGQTVEMQNSRKAKQLEHQINSDYQSMRLRSAISKENEYLDAVTNDFFSVSKPSPKQASSQQFYKKTNKIDRSCESLFEAAKGKSCGDLFKPPREKNLLGPAGAASDYESSGGFSSSRGIR